jgi:hypothetical protein
MSRVPRPDELGLTAREGARLRALRDPAAIQRFVNAIPANYEHAGDTLLSVRRVLRERRAHCIEAALVAACALWLHGEPPLLLDLRAENDFDHVVALFRRRRLWGAISKSNHVALRGRDPVYRNLRELALSYFHEYHNARGERTLREYSRAYDLRSVDPAVWVTAEQDAWEVERRLDLCRHYRLFLAAQRRYLTRIDALERQAKRLVQYPRPRPR